MWNELPSTKRKLRGLAIYSMTGFFFLSLIVYFTWSIRSLLLPMILGGLLAYLCKPLVNKVQVRWLPNAAKVSIVLVGIFSALFFATNGLKTKVPTDDEQLVIQIRLQHKFNKKFEELMGIQKNGQGNVVYNLLKNELDPFVSNLNNLLFLSKEQSLRVETMRKDPFASDLLNDRFFNYYLQNKALMKNLELNEEKRRISSTENHSQEAEEHSSIIVALLNTISTWLLLPFVFIFLLFDNGKILKFFVSLVPNQFFELTLSIVDEVDNAIGKYLRGTILECTLVGLTLTVSFFLIGFEWDVAMIIGIIAGLTNAIPFLGPAIGLGVGLTYGLILEDIQPVLPFITKDNLFVAIFISVLVAQLLDNTVFQPVVLGSAVNLHPLVVIIGVMGGSVIFGFAGMLLAIPSIVIFKVVTETLFKELKAYRII
ncbi:MAG: AI-2E family transporter [Bdellovibrionales bacterium]